MQLGSWFCPTFFFASLKEKEKQGLRGIRGPEWDDSLTRALCFNISGVVVDQGKSLPILGNALAFLRSLETFLIFQMHQPMRWNLFLSKCWVDRDKVEH